MDGLCVYMSVFIISAGGKVFGKHHLSTFRPLRSQLQRGNDVAMSSLWATSCLCKAACIICSRQLHNFVCVCVCVCVCNTHLSCQHFVEQNSICPPVHRASIWLICNDLWEEGEIQFRSSTKQLKQLFLKTAHQKVEN